MTLEQAIAESAAGCRLSLSVFPTSTGYQASLSTDDKKSWRVEMAPDPVTALKKALGLLPGVSGQLRETSAKGVFD